LDGKPEIFVRPSTYLLAPLLLGIAAAPAIAGDTGYPGLPGVERPQPIVAEPEAVTPEGEPDQQPAPGQTGDFRVGDWDVRISGHVAVEVRTSTVRRD
jgi:hypothetical protein